MEEVIGMFGAYGPYKTYLMTKDEMTEKERQFACLQSYELVDGKWVATDKYYVTRSPKYLFFCEENQQIESLTEEQYQRKTKEGVVFKDLQLFTPELGMKYWPPCTC